MDDFRFEGLDIWDEGIEISDFLFDIADLAEKKRFYKFAEQLRGAGMSITNNIAEGSGSFSNREFAQFINFSRRSLFECSNILHIYERRRIIDSKVRIPINLKLIQLSKKLTAFRRSLQ